MYVLNPATLCGVVSSYIYFWCRSFPTYRRRFESLRRCFGRLLINSFSCCDLFDPPPPFCRLMTLSRRNKMGTSSMLSRQVSWYHSYLSHYDHKHHTVYGLDIWYHTLLSLHVSSFVFLILHVFFYFTIFSWLSYQEEKMSRWRSLKLKTNCHSWLELCDCVLWPLFMLQTCYNHYSSLFILTAVFFFIYSPSNTCAWQQSLSISSPM